MTNRIQNRLAELPKPKRLSDYGGQYAAPIGTSTRDKTDRQTDAEALADFNAEWERIRYGIR